MWPALKKERHFQSESEMISRVAIVIKTIVLMLHTTEAITLIAET